MPKWKIIARHKWVSNATITESYDTNDSSIRRFTATVCGWTNFKIFEGRTQKNISKKIVEKVNYIREKIENNEDDIFYENVLIGEN